VKITDKYRLPLFAPETEAGSEAAEPAAPPAGDTKGEKISIRESLERGFEDARKAGGARERAEDGKFKGKKEKPQRAAEEMRAAAAPAEGEEPAAEGAAAPAEGEAAPTEGAAPATEAPAAWTKEAKAAWAALPPAVQAAVTKREADVQKGVDELKAKYTDLDTALAPHLATIRQYGHTPGQAVQQMFAWFSALNANPKQAFPALLQSFKQKPEDIFGAPAPAAAETKPPAAAGDQPAAAVPTEVQAYIDGIKKELGELKQTFGQEIGGLRNSVMSQQERDTQNVLSMWSKDKPHFEAVRSEMARLIQSGAVPLKDGKVDLDGAYEKAIRLNDEIWTATQAQKAAAEEAKRVAAGETKKKAEAEAAEKARRAAVSLTPAAPGAPGAAGTKAKKGKSVRESLMEAIDEARA
jgi:hypothetical protein